MSRSSVVGPFESTPSNGAMLRRSGGRSYRGLSRYVGGRRLRWCRLLFPLRLDVDFVRERGGGDVRKHTAAVDVAFGLDDVPKGSVPLSVEIRVAVQLAPREFSGLR